jgi:predicted nicotinamide N-methyase
MASFKRSNVNNSDSDSDSDDENKRISGYCHMNESGNDKEFSIELFGHNLTVTQDPTCLSKDLGHGAVVWDSAVVFAKYLEISPKFSGLVVKGKRVVELGAGCGLAGLSLMLKGANVTLTDLDPVVEHLTEPNAQSIFAQAGGIGVDIGDEGEGEGSSSSTGSDNIGNDGTLTLIRPTTESLDWTKSYPLPSDGAYDIVLLTDCVFAPALAKPLVNQILRLSDIHTRVLCCHEVRDVDANQEFLAELHTHYSIKKISRKKLHPDFSNDLVQLIEAKMLRTKKGKGKS